MPLTASQLNNIRSNLTRILSVIHNQLMTGRFYQHLNRVAFYLSKPPSEEDSSVNLWIGELFIQYFMPEALRFRKDRLYSESRILRIFDQLLEQKGDAYSITDPPNRIALLKELITTLDCFPTCWATRQSFPTFPTADHSVIDDALYVNRGPKKPLKQLSMPGGKNLAFAYDTGNFFKKIIDERMTLLLPVLQPHETDSLYWHGGIFPINEAEYSIKVSFTNTFLRDTSGQTLAQQMRLVYQNPVGEALCEHLLWYARLVILDESPFNLSAPPRNLLRWSFKLLLEKEKIRVHCSSSIGRTGVYCWLYKTYADLFAQPGNYALITRFLHGDQLTAEECTKIAMIFTHSLDTIRKIRPFVQSDKQLDTTPGQLFMLLAEEFPDLNETDIIELTSIFVASSAHLTKLALPPPKSERSPLRESDDTVLTSSRATSSDETIIPLPGQIKNGDRYLTAEEPSDCSTEGKSIIVIPERFSIRTIPADHAVPAPEAAPPIPNIPQHHWWSFFSCCRRPTETPMPAFS